MRGTPRAMRLHIGFFGRRNAGKSTLLNALTGQDTAIVSPVPGTTTDPVEKAMEFPGLGPVVLVDTGGVDDEGEVGSRRAKRTYEALERCDVVLVVTDGSWGTWEEDLVAAASASGARCIIAFSHADRRIPDEKAARGLVERGFPVLSVSGATGWGLEALREEIARAGQEESQEPRTIVADLVPPGRAAVLVVPLDSEAPRGRLILPQVQTLRDLLDGGRMALVARDLDLKAALRSLAAPPALVVTDSQAFERVAALVPPEVPLTSFSILFSRFLGDLPFQARSAVRVETLRPGDRVLVAEGCTHHPTGDDIGRVKIPAWLRRRTGADLHFSFVQGRDFPEDLRPFSLVVHCGFCMGNRREMASRIRRAQAQEVPLTNYGVLIAHCLGILGRALGPFPAALQAYEEACGAGRLP